MKPFQPTDDAFAQMYHFRRAFEDEVAPLLAKVAKQHDVAFAVTWKRTHPGKRPRIEIAVAVPRQRRTGFPGG